MQNKLTRLFLLSVVLICGSVTGSYGYTIGGVIKNINACYYPRVYLAVINNIDDIYTVSSENIIASADMDASGNFVITGNDLPKDKRYYRLYVTDNAATKSSIYVGAKRNYFLLLLDNNTTVNLSCDDICMLHFTYTVAQSPENAAIAALQDLINSYNKIYAGKDSLGKRKMEFISSKEKEDYSHFADTCRYPLVALLAIKETGLENNYHEEGTFFTAFGNRLQKEIPNSIYTKQYSDELQLLDLKNEVKKGKSPIGYILYTLLFLSLALNIFFFLKSRGVKPSVSEPVADNNATGEENRIRALIGSLSIKEREILLLVNSGLSNKEIAGTLNVEVSTIKTHVSNIYQKTGIKSRKEVPAIARHIQP